MAAAIAVDYGMLGWSQSLSRVFERVIGQGSVRMQREPVGHYSPFETIDDDEEVALIGRQAELDDICESDLIGPLGSKVTVDQIAGVGAYLTYIGAKVASSPSVDNLESLLFHKPVHHFFRDHLRLKAVASNSQDMPDPLGAKGTPALLKDGSDAPS